MTTDWAGNTTLGFMRGVTYAIEVRVLFDALDAHCDIPHWHADRLAASQRRIERAIKAWWGQSLEHARLGAKIQAWVWRDRQMSLECAGNHDLRDWLLGLLPAWPDGWDNTLNKSDVSDVD